MFEVHAARAEKETQMRILIRSSFTLAVLVSLTNPHPAEAQTTAFTYQGRLSDGGAPAEGTYDLRFAIYDSASDLGAVVAGPITNSAARVKNGVFTVVMDFGADAFPGGSRWLEIGVRTMAVPASSIS